MEDLRKDLLNPEIGNREVYEAPKIEVVEVEVEHGFAASGGGGSSPSRDIPSW